MRDHFYTHGPHGRRFVHDFDASGLPNAFVAEEDTSRPRRWAGGEAEFTTEWQMESAAEEVTVG